jgi:hypothetical protein
LERNRAEIVAQLADDMRKRSAAVSERLLKATTGTGQDGAMREDIASIAAGMVALTALNEGPSSPILGLLPESTQRSEGERIDLAQRAATILSEPG